MGNALNSNIESLFGKMEDFISTKTVVGDPIHVGDVLVIPLIEVTFGVGVGLNSPEASEDKKKKESALGGMGGKITPSAVLVIINGAVQLVNVKNQDSVNKLIDMVPGILSKLNFNFGKKKKDEDFKFDSESIDI